MKARVHILAACLYTLIHSSFGWATAHVEPTESVIPPANQNVSEVMDRAGELGEKVEQRLKQMKDLQIELNSIDKNSPDSKVRIDAFQQKFDEQMKEFFDEMQLTSEYNEFFSKVKAFELEFQSILSGDKDKTSKELEKLGIDEKGNLILKDGVFTGRIGQLYQELMDKVKKKYENNNASSTFPPFLFESLQVRMNSMMAKKDIAEKFNQPATVLGINGQKIDINCATGEACFQSPGLALPESFIDRNLFQNLLKDPTDLKNKPTTQKDNPVASSPAKPAIPEGAASAFATPPEIGRQTPSISSRIADTVRNTPPITARHTETPNTDRPFVNGQVVNNSDPAFQKSPPVEQATAAKPTGQNSMEGPTPQIKPSTNSTPSTTASAPPTKNTPVASSNLSPKPVASNSKPSVASAGPVAALTPSNSSPAATSPSHGPGVSERTLAGAPSNTDTSAHLAGPSRQVKPAAKPAYLKEKNLTPPATVSAVSTGSKQLISANTPSADSVIRYSPPTFGGTNTTPTNISTVSSDLEGPSNLPQPKLEDPRVAAPSNLGVSIVGRTGSSLMRNVNSLPEPNVATTYQSWDEGGYPDYVRPVEQPSDIRSPKMKAVAELGEPVLEGTRQLSEPNTTYLYAPGFNPTKEEATLVSVLKESSNVETTSTNSPPVLGLSDSEKINNLNLALSVLSGPVVPGPGVLDTPGFMPVGTVGEVGGRSSDLGNLIAEITGETAKKPVRKNKLTLDQVAAFLNTPVRIPTPSQFQ